MDFGITSALIVMGGLGLLFGAGLAVASRVFHVHKDPRILKIEGILPNANCGACGAPGCAGFAEGVVEGRYRVNQCTVGGEEGARLIAEIMGTEAGATGKQVAVGFADVVPQAGQPASLPDGVNRGGRQALR